MIRTGIAAFIVAIVATVTVAPTARSAKVEFTPVVGKLMPLNSQIASSDAALVIRQSAATAYGARLDVWVASRIAVGAGVAVGPSSIQLIGGTALSLDAQMLQLDVRARVRLNDPASDTGFDVIAGFGWSDLGDPLSDLGEDQDLLKTPKKFTGIFGVGATVPVSDRVRLRFDAEDHIHSSNFEIDQTTFGYPIEDRTQHDVLITAGLVVPLW